MKVLVTGGAGYIGSHAVRELVKNGHEVIVFDNLSKGHKEAIRGIPLVVGNLADVDMLTETLTSNKIEAVMHFAADSLVGESMENPQKYYKNNVCGSVSLFEAMLKANVKHIVFSSTAALFGEPDNIPITEKTKTHPSSVYGRTKLMIETILKDYDDAYGMKYAALRYFNAAGAHPEGDIGEDHSPESHLIPIILQAAMGKRSKVQIFGDDYNTEDGTCVRDYIHVCDLAQAHVLALEDIVKTDRSRAYNLGNGKGYSVLEIINAARRVTGKDIPCEVSQRRPGDPNILIASAASIQNELGWECKFTSIDDIIETAWKWHKNHPEGFEGA